MVVAASVVGDMRCFRLVELGLGQPVWCLDPGGWPGEFDFRFYRKWLAVTERKQNKGCTLEEWKSGPGK